MQLEQVKKEIIPHIKTMKEKFNKTTANIQASVCNKLQHHQVSMINGMLQYPDVSQNDGCVALKLHF